MMSTVTGRYIKLCGASSIFGPRSGIWEEIVDNQGLLPRIYEERIMCQNGVYTHNINRIIIRVTTNAIEACFGEIKYTS